MTVEKSPLHSSPRLGFECYTVVVRSTLELRKTSFPVQSPSFNFFNEIEKVELAEEVFGTNVPLDMAFDNPREIVDYLVLQLRGWGPNPFASDFLKQLATKRNSPGLAQGLHDSWRREQIAAVIQEIFNIGDLSTGGDDDTVIPVRRPRGPKSGSQGAAQSLDEDHPSGRG